MSDNKRMRWDCIYDRIKDIPEPIGAEIGVHRGECSANLLRLHRGLYLYMIDSWSPDTYKGHESGATKEYREMYENQCSENFDHAYEVTLPYQNRISILQMFSLEAAANFPNHKLDFVFIDAAHDYESVIADIKAWLPKIKPGGWIMFHDFDNPNFPGVADAVREMFFDASIDLDVSDYFAAVRV
jgi:hypothetical protein